MKEEEEGEEEVEIEKEETNEEGMEGEQREMVNAHEEEEREREGRGEECRGKRADIWRKGYREQNTISVCVSLSTRTPYTYSNQYS